MQRACSVHAVHMQCICSASAVGRLREGVGEGRARADRLGPAVLEGRGGGGLVGRRGVTWLELG